MEGAGNGGPIYHRHYTSAIGGSLREIAIQGVEMKKKKDKYFKRDAIVIGTLALATVFIYMFGYAHFAH